MNFLATFLQTFTKKVKKYYLITSIFIIIVFYEQPLYMYSTAMKTSIKIIQYVYITNYVFGIR